MDFKRQNSTHRKQDTRLRIDCKARLAMVGVCNNVNGYRCWMKDLWHISQHSKWFPVKGNRVSGHHLWCPCLMRKGHLLWQLSLCPPQPLAPFVSCRSLSWVETVPPALGDASLLFYKPIMTWLVYKLHWPKKPPPPHPGLLGLCPW